MPESQVRETVADVTAWLVEEARLIEETGAFDLALVERLRAAGIPIRRFTTGIPSLHPQVDSFSTLWEEGKGLTFRQFRASDEMADTLSRSLIVITYREGRVVRRRLEGPPEPDEYELLGRLRQEGFTDYVVVPLPFSDGSNKAMSFATDRPGGYSDDDIAVLSGIRHALAATAEVRYLRHLTRTLVETYVGPVAGRRVLEGAIKRGSGETIRAAIWFCDLKGFTALSESLPPDALLELLNSYFDCIARAVAEGEGEILKFIGDAVLAIFQPKDDDDAEAAGRALASAQSAIAALDGVNRDRRAGGHHAIDCGIALHFGDVVYGNVGAETRLDFTVIGPAVNLASRIEGLTRELQRPLLTSEAFASLHGGDFERLGDFDLKGIAGARAVYAPR